MTQSITEFLDGYPSPLATAAKTNWCCEGNGKGGHAGPCRYADANFNPVCAAPAPALEHPLFTLMGIPVYVRSDMPEERIVVSANVAREIERRGIGATRDQDGKRIKQAAEIGK